MTLNTIYNESCMETMKKMKEHSVDIVLNIKKPSAMGK